MKFIYSAIFLFCFQFSIGQHEFNNLLSEKRYSECINQADEGIKSTPKDSSYYYYKGICLIENRAYEEGIEWLEEAQRMAYPNPASIGLYKAMAWANLDKEKAIEILEALVSSGLRTYKPLSSHHFLVLEPDSRYQELKETVYNRANPCYTDTNYKKMDFWLGNWVVYSNGKYSGENVIEKLPGGCAILEKYSTARDYVGQSYNYYDQDDGLWKQIWIDHGKNILNFEETESRDSGYIQFLAQPTKTNPNYTRMTFTLREDGSVQQFLEQSANLEKWTVIFNGTYIRQNVKN